MPPLLVLAALVVLAADVAAPSEPPLPGAKYNYYVQANAGTDLSADSAAKTCELPPPAFLSVTTSATVCSIALASGFNTSFRYEWDYGAAGWTAAQASGILAAGCGSTDSTCNFNMPVAAGTYFVAVRAFTLAGLYGKWSTEVPCKKQ